MEAYRDQYASLFNGGDGVSLLAVSTDSVDVLQSWAEDAGFQYTFGSDPDAEMGRSYGAFRRLDDGTYIDNRTVFVIDPEGVVRYVASPFREIDPTAYEELAAAIDAVAEGRPVPAGEAPAGQETGQEEEAGAEAD